MTLADYLVKKGADAARIATAKEVKRQVALNLQKGGFPPAKMAEILEVSLDELEEYLQPTAS